jgi:hypothetical protein
MIQYKQKGNTPIVKLYDSFAFSEIENTVVTKEGEASS